MRIFLDANILFSAAKSDGAIRRLLTLLREAGHECWVDGYVIEEARRNLHLKAPESGAALVDLLAMLHVANVQPLNPKVDSALPLPPKDRPVLAAAIGLQCKALISGDRKHFGALYGKAVRGVTIHSPQSIAELLLE
jgi:predicted nucleic acid-binding protein